MAEVHRNQQAHNLSHLHSQASQVHNVAQLLQYLDTNTRDKSARDSFDKKAIVDEPRSFLVEYQKTMLPYATKAIDIQQKLNNVTVERNKSAKQFNVIAAAPKPNVNAGVMDKTRLLLAHFGYLNFENREQLRYADHVEIKGKRFIKELDKINDREIIKVGLIYVGFGQEDEGDLFKNQMNDASPQYIEFARGMAEVVKIDGHQGYGGQLERHKVGEDFLYYATPMLELAFHETVRMPNSEKEEALIEKKRHVGNDLVHIVWSEHCKDYPTNTIVSQFNKAHVIIYPLANGLFRIQVGSKKDLPDISPLIHNMVVPKELLPTLVRETIIVARLVATTTLQGYSSPFQTRKVRFAEFREKHSELTQNYQKFLEKVVV
jgi:hypothetical protein